MPPPAITCPTDRELRLTPVPAAAALRREPKRPPLRRAVPGKDFLQRLREAGL